MELNCKCGCQLNTVACPTPLSGTISTDVEIDVANSSSDRYDNCPNGRQWRICSECGRLSIVEYDGTITWYLPDGSTATPT